MAAEFRVRQILARQGEVKKEERVLHSSKDL